MRSLHPSLANLLHHSEDTNELGSGTPGCYTPCYLTGDVSVPYVCREDCTGKCQCFCTSSHQTVAQLTTPFHRKELDILGRLLQIPEGERLRFCQQLISISDSFVAKITSVIQFCSIPTFTLPLVKGMFH